jgi:hypothetical protein
MAPLRRSALGTQLNTLGRVPEVAVFEPVVRVETGAGASVRDMSVRLPPLRDIARMLLVVFGLSAAIAVLTFSGWLMFSEARQQAALDIGAVWDCTNMGRGGVYCVKSSLNSAPSNRRVGPQEECTSLGRGGLVCVKHPVNAYRSIHPAGA